MEFIMAIVFAIMTISMALAMLTMFVDYDEPELSEIGINLGR